MKRVPVFVHIAFPAPGAFHRQHAGKIIRTLGRCCAHAAKLRFFFKQEAIRRKLMSKKQMSRKQKAKSKKLL
jgi:hypothetical protein